MGKLGIGMLRMSILDLGTLGMATQGIGIAKVDHFRLLISLFY